MANKLTYQVLQDRKPDLHNLQQHLSPFPLPIYLMRCFKQPRQLSLETFWRFNICELSGARLNIDQQTEASLLITKIA